MTKRVEGELVLRSQERREEEGESEREKERKGRKGCYIGEGYLREGRGGERLLREGNYKGKGMNLQVKVRVRNELYKLRIRVNAK